MNDVDVEDNSGRRKVNDRREFAYTFHLPERRSGVDRRVGKDRREANRQNPRE